MTEERSRATRQRLGIGATAFLVITVLGPSVARAQAMTTDGQRSLSIERFRLATDGHGVLDVEGGRVSSRGDWNLGLWGNYSNDPLVIRNSDTDTRLGAPVHHRLSAGLTFAYALTDSFQLGASLPFVLWQSGQRDIPGVAGLAGTDLGVV